MKKISTLKKLLIAGLYACALSAVFLVPAVTHAITVGPAKIEQTLNPGETVTGEMFLKNEESEARTFYPAFEKFTEQDGTKVFIKDESLLSSWISTEKSVTLAPGEDKRFSYSITLPKDAPPGGHFAVVWWSTNPPEASADKQVAIQTRAGILVYVNVRGNVKEAASVRSFSVKNKYISGPSDEFGLSISNDGNSYIKPAGNIVITSLFGRVRDTLAINEKGLQILPKSYKDIGTTQWTGSGFYIGPYKALATVKYGENSAFETTQAMWIWVIPWKIILISIAVLFLLIFAVRKYNQWLINKTRANFRK